MLMMDLLTSLSSLGSMNWDLNSSSVNRSRNLLPSMNCSRPTTFSKSILVQLVVALKSTFTSDVIIFESSLWYYGLFLILIIISTSRVGKCLLGCYAELRVLKEAKPFVPHRIFMSLIVQLILSKLVYRSSILANASCRNLNTLQAVINTVARLIYGRRSSDHITPLLMNLH